MMEIAIEIIGVAIVIIVQLVSIGVFIGQNKEFKAHLMYRLNELEKKQDKHNNLIERMTIAEQGIKEVCHRIDTLEKK